MLFRSQELIHTVSPPGLQRGWVTIRWKCRLRFAWKLTLQRSVAVGLLDAAGAAVDLGNVTIPENFAVPEVGAVVEIRFLYQFESGCFEQPVYLGPRHDIDRAEALLSQVTRIKRKSLTSAA